MLCQRHVAVVFAAFFFFAAGPLAAQQPNPAKSNVSSKRAGSDAKSQGDIPALSQSLVTEGVRVEVELSRPPGGAVVAGENVDVRVQLSDAETGEPLTSAMLGAWIDRRDGSALIDSMACFDKVQGYVRGTLQVRPAVDLNSYLVLALNNGNTISVIDPFLGFGSSKLYTTVILPGAGEDWALDEGRGRLFVTMPLINQVAVVSTTNWKVQETLDVGTRPTRIVMQPDTRYLWVTTEGVGGSGSGVTVIDAVTAKVVKQIVTGEGAHAFAFVDAVSAGLADSGGHMPEHASHSEHADHADHSEHYGHVRETGLAFITNRESGTVSVVEVGSLAKVADIKTGPSPSDVAFSAVGNAVYVVHEGDGSILAIDAKSTELRARIGSSPGLTTIGFDYNGRWGVVLNGAEDAVYIVDATTATVRHAVPVPEGPDQVSFTPNFAYVRSTGSVDVTMIPLAGLESEGEVAAQLFPTGQYPAAKFGDVGTAAAIMSAHGSSPTPGLHPRTMQGHMADAVYVANPADKSIYYYHYMEGMPTPSGRLNNYGFEPKAVLTVGRNLRQTEPGVYTTTVIAPPKGPHDFLFLLDEPRIIHCFEFEIAENRTRDSDAPLSLQVEPLWSGRDAKAGEPTRLEFKLTEVTSGAAEVGVNDIWVIAYNTAGRRIEQQAEHVDGGVYGVTLTLPEPGVYYVLVASRSLGLQPQNQVPAALQAVAR